MVSWMVSWRFRKSTKPSTKPSRNEVKTHETGKSALAVLNIIYPQARIFGFVAHFSWFRLFLHGFVMVSWWFRGGFVRFRIVSFRLKHSRLKNACRKSKVFFLKSIFFLITHHYIKNFRWYLQHITISKKNFWFSADLKMFDTFGHILSISNLSLTYENMCFST